MGCYSYGCEMKLKYPHHPPPPTYSEWVCVCVCECVTESVLYVPSDVFVVVAEKFQKFYIRHVPYVSVHMCTKYLISPTQYTLPIQNKMAAWKKRRPVTLIGYKIMYSARRFLAFFSKEYTHKICTYYYYCCCCVLLCVFFCFF